MSQKVGILVGICTIAAILLGGVLNLAARFDNATDLIRENSTRIDRNCLVLKQLDQDIRLHIIASEVHRRRVTDLLPPVDC